MKPPRIPPMVTDIIQTALSSLDGMEFSAITSCPLCGGPVHAHDWKKKKFAVLRESAGNRVITVRVKRFYCRQCDRLLYADEPFYPGTRIGSLIIDLFISLSATLPQSRAARVIDVMGIIVDRTTWKYYTSRSFPDIPVVDIFGINIPVSIVRVSTLVPQSEGPSAVDVITACGYPSRRAGTPALPVRSDNNENRQ